MAKVHKLETGYKPGLGYKEMEAELPASRRHLENMVKEGMPSKLDHRGQRRFQLDECRTWLEARAERKLAEKKAKAS